MTVAAETALDGSVLVLNRLYMAVHVISVRRAFAMLFREAAEVLVYEDDRYNSYNFSSWLEVSQARDRFSGDGVEWIRAVNFDIMVPKIIRLLFYDRLPAQQVKFNRRNIFARDRNRCQYCGKRFPTTELSLDHVVPKSQGGHTVWENIVCACTECNARKGGRTPVQARMTLIRKPERPKRSPVIRVKLSSSKYRCWQAFLDNAYWSVELR